MTDTTRTLIDYTTRELFTNGVNEVARRLVHHSKDGKDRGGWCETAVRDVLTRTLGKRIEELEESVRLLQTEVIERVDNLAAAVFEAANAMRKDATK